MGLTVCWKLYEAFNFSAYNPGEHKLKFIFLILPNIIFVILNNERCFLLEQKNLLFSVQDPLINLIPRYYILILNLTKLAKSSTKIIILSFYLKIVFDRYLFNNKCRFFVPLLSNFVSFNYLLLYNVLSSKLSELHKSSHCY